MQVPLAGVRWSPSGTGAQSPEMHNSHDTFSNDWALKSLIIVHLHHVPDLLRLTALNKLVQGQQSLSMGPSRKLWHLWVTCVNFMTILWLWSHNRPSPQLSNQFHNIGNCTGSSLIIITMIISSPSPKSPEVGFLCQEWVDAHALAGLVQAEDWHGDCFSHDHDWHCDTWWHVMLWIWLILSWYWHALMFSQLYLSIRRPGGGEAEGLGMAGEVGAVWLRWKGFYWYKRYFQVIRWSWHGADCKNCSNKSFSVVLLIICGKSPTPTYHRTSRCRSVLHCLESPALIDWSVNTCTSDGSSTTRRRNIFVIYSCQTIMVIGKIPWQTTGVRRHSGLCFFKGRDAWPSSVKLPLFRFGLPTPWQRSQ